MVNYSSKKIVAVVDRWSLLRDHFCNKNYKWDPQKGERRYICFMVRTLKRHIATCRFYVRFSFKMWKTQMECGNVPLQTKHNVSNVVIITNIQTSVDFFSWGEEKYSNISRENCSSLLTVLILFRGFSWCIQFFVLFWSFTNLLTITEHLDGHLRLTTTFSITDLKIILQSVSRV